MIHRRDLGNLPYSTKQGFAPPDDNRMIDQYGHTMVPVGVPTEFPKTCFVGETIIWGGTKYRVNTIENTANAAFNLQTDINDPQIEKNPKYKKIAPMFTLQITCNQVSTTSSTIPSIALAKLIITIPVYKTEDYQQLVGGFNTDPIVKYSLKDRTIQDFSSFGTVSSVFYGYTSSNDTIQIVPKTMCVIDEAARRNVSPIKWSSYCPANPSKMTSSTLVCRGKNMSENQGYNQGRILYVEGTNSYTSGQMKIFRASKYTPEFGPAMPNTIEDDSGIPVQVEGEGPNGEKTTYKIVADTPAPALSLTELGVSWYVSLTLIVVLLVVMWLPPNGRESGGGAIMGRMFLTIAVMITSVMLATKTFTAFSIAGLTITAAIGFMIWLFTLIHVLSKDSYPAGVDNVIFFTVIIGFMFISNGVMSFYEQKADPKNSESLMYYNISRAFSYIPKVIAVLVLFMSNPLGNLLAITSIGGVKFNPKDLSRGLDDIRKNKYISSEAAEFLRSKTPIRVNSDAKALAGTMIDNTKARVYYEMSRTTDPNEKIVTSTIVTKGEGEDVFSSPRNPRIEGYQPAEPAGAIKFDAYKIPLDQMVMAGFVLFSLFLILAQPTPPAPKEENNQQITPFVINTLITIVLAVIVMVAYSRGIWGHNFNIFVVLLGIVIAVGGNVAWNGINSFYNYR